MVPQQQDGDEADLRLRRARPEASDGGVPVRKEATPALHLPLHCLAACPCDSPCLRLPFLAAVQLLFCPLPPSLPRCSEIDEDQSGSLDFDEFEQALINMGIRLTAAQIKWVMGHLDTDGDGEVRRPAGTALLSLRSLPSAAPPLSALPFHCLFLCMCVCGRCGSLMFHALPLSHTERRDACVLPFLLLALTLITLRLLLLAGLNGRVHVEDLLGQGDTFGHGRRRAREGLHRPQGRQGGRTQDVRGDRQAGRDRGGVRPLLFNCCTTDPLLLPVLSLPSFLPCHMACTPSQMLVY
eukprot:SAG22_NODE_2007_length_3152_cov_3.209630_3_plen_296_part_00